MNLLGKRINKAVETLNEVFAVVGEEFVFSGRDKNRRAWGSQNYRVMHVGAHNEYCLEGFFKDAKGQWVSIGVSDLSNIYEFGYSCVLSRLESVMLLSKDICQHTVDVARWMRENVADEEE